MSNFFTKLTSAVGIATLVAASTSASLVAAASEFLPYAEALADNGVINAQSTEAGYRLGNNVTRAELAKVVANLGGIEAMECSGDVYSDVGAGLGDLCGYVEALADAGVVSTASATFRPSANITRAEMVKMILGALGETPSDVDAGYMDVAGLGDLAGYINRANEIGCVGDADYFRPNASSSRGEAFKVAVICSGLDVDMGGDTGSTGGDTGSTGGTTGGTTGTTGSTGTVAGNLAVALEGQAMAQYVPKNASAVKVGTVKLSAGSSDVTVRSLTVTRSGLGNAADIPSNNGIRAAQNGIVVSSSSDFYNATSQNGTVYFFPALVVKAGSSQMVDVLVNLSGAENSQHQFALTAVNADNTTVTGAPVTLGLLNTTSYVTTTVSTSGTYNYNVAPGKTQQTIAKVDLTAGSRDITVNGFTLTRSGSNDLTKRFANVKVYKNGVAVGNAVVTSDKLAVTGLAHALASGNFQSFEVKADILVDGTSNSAVGFRFESTSDVAAVEVATGFSTQTNIQQASGNVGTVTFSNVDVTYTKQSSANQTVAPGASNVTLFDARLTSTVPLSVRQLVITNTVVNSGAVAFANDQLSIRVNGSEVATITSGDMTGVIGSFNKTVSIPVDTATSARITIVGSSVKNTVSGTQNFTLQVKLTDVRDAANNTVSLLTDTVTGDRTTVQAPTLNLKNATVAAPTNDKLSSTTNQEVGRFGFTAEGDAVRVTKMVINNVGTALLTEVVDQSSIELRDVATDAKLQGTVTLSGNMITVDSMSNDIAKDVTQNIKVVFMSVKSLDSSYGSGVQLRVVAPADLTTTTVNGGSVVTVPAVTVNAKAYTIGVVPPTLLVTPNTPLMQNSRIATIKVTNPDSNTGITVNTVNVTFNARSTAQGNFSFSGMLCLRDVGSNASCGSAGTTAGQSATQAGGTYTFNIAASTLANATTTLLKNGGNVEYEVYLDNAPLWVAGDNANITVNSVNYSAGAATSTQSYVGVTGASATATK